MKKITIFLSLAILLGCLGPLAAQKPVAGRYKGHMVKMRYVSGNTRDDIEYLEYDGVELTKKISDLNSKIDNLNSQIKKLESQSPKPKNKNQGTKTDTAQERRMWELERDNHNYRIQVDSLQEQVLFLKDSVRFWKDSLNKLNHVIDSLIKSTSDLSGNRTGVDNLNGSGQHVGVYGSIGSPWLMNELLNGESPMWSFSFQGGLYWGSRSLLPNFPLSLGVGLEYSRVLLVAGMGHYYKAIDSIDNVPIVDIDSDNYTARLTLLDVKEKATLRYLSIPLTLSIGQPYCDRISGYAQITVALSLCLKSSLSTTGNYNLEGYYSDWHLTLTEFPRLGFGSDQRIEEKKEELKVNGVLFTGRLAGGVYVPLCRIKQHETSPWVLKLGVKLDYSISPAAKKAEQEDKPSRVVFNATDYITQNNFLSGGRFSFLNPGVEVGIMYIFGTKNR